MLEEFNVIPWKDIIELAVMSLAFFYWAYAVQNYQLLLKEKLPNFMLNKKLMLGLGFACGALAVSKFF